MDDILYINTEEDQPFPSNQHYHRYEPTNYNDLKVLCDYLSTIIKPYDKLVDFGSGLMRVPIYVNYALNIKTVGIEMNKQLYLRGLGNIESYYTHYDVTNKVASINLNALEYEFTKEDTLLFFFNPFSSQIFTTVINNFLQSYTYNKPVYVILYYAKREYIDSLNLIDIFTLKHEIELPNYHQDKNELLLIYEIKSY